MTNQSRVETGQAVERAARVFMALVRAGRTMSPGALPASLEPARHRPVGGFAIDSATSLALSLVYQGAAAAPAAREFKAMRARAGLDASAREQAYEADLQRIVAELRPQLDLTVREVLQSHLQTVRTLSGIHDAGGMDEALHRSCRRVLRRMTAPASAGGAPAAADDIAGQKGQPTAADAPGTPDATATDSRAAPGPVTPGEQLPGGVADPPAEQPAPPVLPAQTAPLDRKALLAAIAQERNALDEGDALEPADQGAARQSREVGQILAAMSLLPRAVMLVDAYARSPLAGSAALRAEFARATGALIELRQRLTSSTDRDDAWKYAPLVVAAVHRLGWHTIPAASEFAVALGRVLALTRTKPLLQAFSLVIAALSLGLGPAAGTIGTAVLGALDLALSGTTVAVDLMEAHEAALSGDASLLLAKEESLAQQGQGDGSFALDVAAALLSAVAFTRNLRDVKGLLSRRPREPEALQLDRQPKDLAAIAARLEDAIHEAGTIKPKRLRPGGPLDEVVTPAPAVTLEDLAPGGRKVTQREVRNQFGPLIAEQMPSPQQMAARARAAKAEPGAKQLRATNRSADAIERYELTDAERATAGGPMRDDITEQISGPEPKPFPVGNYNEFDPADLDVELPRTLPLEELPRARPGQGRVVTPDQKMLDVFWSRKEFEWPEEIKAWARQQLPDGAADPLVKSMRIGPDNVLTIDHIVSVERFKQFPGYFRLTRQNQQIVYTYRRNLMPVGGSVNSSRGSKTFKEWTHYKDMPLDPTMRKEMAALEDQLEVELQQLIDDLLAEQDAFRGTSRDIGDRGLTAPLWPSGSIRGSVSQETDEKSRRISSSRSLQGQRQR